jgi:NAD+ diphosphatase
MSDQNLFKDLVYSGLTLDRASESRPSVEKIRTLEVQRKKKILPVWNGEQLFDSDSDNMLALSSEDWGFADEDLVFLGSSDSNIWFAAIVRSKSLAEKIQEFGDFGSLNSKVNNLTPDEAALLAYARGMVIWHLNHLYCGCCGSATNMNESGHVRECGDLECNHRIFPRIDPAIICLVEHPDGDHCLLGRQSHWPDGMYSVVAGFVEHGETLEECVIREVKEETGIIVAEVDYKASQPWPFPSSIMLGFFAKAQTEIFAPDDNELEDIRWVSRAELSTFGEMADLGNSFKLPNTWSISRRLIDSWRSK